MKKLIFGIIFIFNIVTFSQAKTNYEVTISTSAGSRLSIVLPYPSLVGMPEAVVTESYYSVLARDLEETGIFEVIKREALVASDTMPYGNIKTSATGWLLVANVSRNLVGKIEVTVNTIAVGGNNDRSLVFSKSYTDRNGSLRRIAHRIADDLVLRVTGDRGVAATRVVFVKEVVSGIKEIYQIDRDGNNIISLTSHNSLTISPTVANDGKLAYVTYKFGRPEIWGQLVPGAVHVKLYPHSHNTEEHYFCPSWSPDGKRIAIVQEHRGNSDILVLDIASGRIRRLTNSSCINTEPSWNPAGTQIAFTSDRNGTPQIFIMGDDGSNLRRLTWEGSYNSSPAWSPFGSMIAYVSRFEGKFNLFVYKLEEKKSYQITTGISSSESPSWSPDERHILFTSGGTVGKQLHTVNLSGNVLCKLSHLVGCQSPKWTNCN